MPLGTWCSDRRSKARGGATFAAAGAAYPVTAEQAAAGIGTALIRRSANGVHRVASSAYGVCNSLRGACSSSRNALMTRGKRGTAMNMTASLWNWLRRRRKQAFAKGRPVLYLPEGYTANAGGISPPCGVFFGGAGWHITAKSGPRYQSNRSKGFDTRSQAPWRRRCRRPDFRVARGQ